MASKPAMARKARPFSEKQRGKKARPGVTSTRKADIKARRPDKASSFPKKRKADNAETDRSSDRKKPRISAPKNHGLGNQSLTSKDFSAVESSKSLSRIMSFLDSGPWYEVSATLATTTGRNEALDGEALTVSNNGGALRRDVSVETMRQKGEELMERVAAQYEKSRGKDSDMRWVMMACKTGTIADKVAAFTVLLQDNAVANLRSLDALLGLVTSKGGKRLAGMGMDSLKELFVTRLLPDRKLKFLLQQVVQAQAGTSEEAQVLLWYWEDCLKQRYEQFVASLEEASKDNLPFLKEKALKTIYELLKSKPEQEQRLLSALVNKLGDPERKISSNAGYYLSGLVTVHPNMKLVVVQEVDGFLFRPHLALRSKYQAVVFLNQIVLSNRKDGPKIARRLIDTYFSLFKVITIGESRSSDEMQRRMGKKRRKADENVEKDGGLIEIDSRLLSALLTGVNRAFPFVAAEEVDTLVEEHTPVLFRLVHSQSFNVGVQALMLLYQLVTKKNTMSDRLYRALYAVLLSPSLSKSTKVEMFLGLVFKAIKADISSKRMAAFAKRLMQVALQGSPSFACGCLLLLSEVLKSRPTLWHGVSFAEDADDEVEHFEDFKDDEKARIDGKLADNLVNGHLSQSADSDSEFGKLQKDGHYNARHRDPSFCNADRACWWELTALKFHAHPSVAAMARTLLSGANIIYDGDPLRDLAFGAFLDRFAEKKPKSQRKNEAWHGSLPLAPSKKVSILPVGIEFLNLEEKEVAPEDVIFHKFYTSKAAKKTKSMKVDKKKDDILLTGEDNFFGDESDDDEIEALLDEDAGGEMGLDDLSDEEDESEGEWTYHQTESNDGEHDEEIAFEGINKAHLNEDYFHDANNSSGSGFEEDSEHAEGLLSSIIEDGRQHNRSKDQRKQKSRKGKKSSSKNGPVKSPFADIDDYSHILENDTPKEKRSKPVLSKRKPK